MLSREGQAAPSASRGKWGKSHCSAQKDLEQASFQGGFGQNT